MKTQALLGERGDELSVIAMHSNVAYYLRTVGALTFSTSALATGGDIVWGGGGIGLTNTEVSYFMGLRVVVDDMLKPTVNDGGADQYPVYLMGSGSVSEGVQRDFFTEADRNILSKQDVMSWTHDYGFHVFGTTWENDVMSWTHELEVCLRLPPVRHHLEERQRQPRQHYLGMELSQRALTGSVSMAHLTPATLATEPSSSVY